VTVITRIWVFLAQLADPRTDVAGSKPKRP
jgi:hypothetical protein